MNLGSATVAAVVGFDEPFQPASRKTILLFDRDELKRSVEKSTMNCTLLNNDLIE